MTQLTIDDIKPEKPKLFTGESFNTPQGVVIRILEKYCVGYENKKKASFLLKKVNEILAYDKQIKNAFELRLLIKKIRNSGTYLRVVGSTSAGIWLACENDEVKANGYMVSRIKSSIQTAIKNGVDIDIFYSILKELKNLGLPQNNQTRYQFNTEKKIIKRLSDDLKKN